MSPDPSGRYQSRLFNFLNRQSIKLTAQYDRAIRHLKVATTWGVQILLYPVYLVVQTGLAAGRQLQAAAQAGWPQIKALTQSQPNPETPPAADTPIQQVLSEVKTLLASATPNPEAALPTVVSGLDRQELVRTTANQQALAHEPLTAGIEIRTLGGITVSLASDEHYLIQGVASQLETRTLVLVTTQNQILDILTPQQQQKLASRISWEMADLRRQWRLAAALKRQAPQPLAHREQPRVFLPIRLFWQLMAWVQTSPVAIAANVFQEARLVDYFASPPGQLQPQRDLPQLESHSSTIQPHRALVFLDRTVAELESHQLVPGSEVIVTLSDRATSVLRKQTQTLRQRRQTPFLTPKGTTQVPADSQSNALRIYALIQAAVDYFFGRRHSHLSETASPAQQTAQGRISGRSERDLASLPPDTTASDLGLAFSEPDPWLSWDDLFGNSEAADFTPVARASDDESLNSQAQLPEALNSKVPVKRETIWSRIRHYLSPEASPGKLSASRTKPPRVNIEELPPLVQMPELKASTKGMLQAQNKQRRATSKKAKPASAALRSRQTHDLPTRETTSLTKHSSPPDNHLESAPDWIEAKSTPVGYVKHPLERLLEWLDTAMLWLEELIVNIWRWVKRR